jgi:hypothetical protein
MIALTHGEAFEIVGALELLKLGHKHEGIVEIMTDLLRTKLAQPESQSQWKYDPMTGRSLKNPDDISPWENYCYERGYFHALEVVRQTSQRDFKFSTTEEAKQPAPTPAGEPQLTDDEVRFAHAFTALLKSGYGKEAEIVLKRNPVWRGLTTAETKALWNVTKKPTEFSEMLQAKLREKNT